MLNRVILIGRLTKDPETKVTTSGIQVGTFSLAVNRSFASANGEKETDFFNCVCYRGLAENVGRYVKKGSMVGVEGRIQNRTYEQNGVKKYFTEIVCDNVVFLDSKSSNATANSSFQQQQPSFNVKEQQPKFTQNNPMFSNNSGNNAQANNQQKDDYFDENPNIDISEDDLPF